jgi:amidophosphoribosyltransferase
MIVICSETCALDIVQIPNWREVEPGEIILIDQNGLSTEVYTQSSKSHCIFELIYFARPDSTVFDYSTHVVRERMGELLAGHDPQQGDIVISVPDSGNSAAFGYSHVSRSPIEMGLARNHYTGRTFIQPTSYQREFGVRMKLHPIREVIRDKRITLVDDSLVRGTTSKTIVKLLKENGAKEVHLRLSAPEIRFPCFFGIDIPTREELISCHMSPKEIARFIGAESVQFLPIEHLQQCIDNPQDFCYACFSGRYPVEIEQSF